MRTPEAETFRKSEEIREGCGQAFGRVRQGDSPSGKWTRVR
jgi:hypothetical protein